MPKGVPNKRYTPEFKKLVVETMQEEKLSYRETAKQFEISDDKRIAWLFSLFKPAMTKFTRAELRNILGVACTEGIENRLVALHTDCCRSHA